MSEPQKASSRPVRLQSARVDFASAAMIRVLAQGMRECGLDPGPLAPASGEAPCTGVGPRRPRPLRAVAAARTLHPLAASVRDRVVHSNAGEDQALQLGRWHGAVSGRGSGRLGCTCGAAGSDRTAPCMRLGRRRACLAGAGGQRHRGGSRARSHCELAVFVGRSDAERSLLPWR